MIREFTSDERSHNAARHNFEEQDDHHNTLPNTAAAGGAAEKEEETEATTTTTTKSSASSIRCLSWRRDNRKIAAGSSDGHVLIWDVLTGELETRFTNVGTLSHVEFTKDFKALLLSPSGFKAPMFRAISKRSGFMWPDTIVPLPYGSTDEADVHGCPAILTKSGNYCIYATTRGGLCVARLKEEGEGTQMRRGWTLVQTIDLVANDAKMVKRLELSRDGRTLLVVSFSKGIVAYDVTGDVEDKNREKNDESLQEENLKNDRNTTVLTNRRLFENEHSQSAWESACVAFDNQFVYATSSLASHEVHCWDLKTLELTRVLEGPNEAKGLVRSCYHPKRPLMIGVGANGIMYVWAKVYEESWTAFQPDFQELKENREYVEREDEFDIKDDDEDDETKAKKKKERKSNVVYLDDASSLTFADLKLWDTDLSAYWTDADEDVLHYLPVEVIVDYEVQAQMEEKKKKWERKQALKAERKKKEEEEEKDKNGEKEGDDTDEMIKKQKMDGSVEGEDAATMETSVSPEDNDDKEKVPADDDPMEWKM